MYLLEFKAKMNELLHQFSDDVRSGHHKVKDFDRGEIIQGEWMREFQLWLDNYYS